MLNKFIALVVMTLIVTFNAVAQTSNDGGGEMSSAHVAVLQKWLATKPALRLETEQDYTPESLGFARQSEGKKFVPYYLAGDFNGDRKQDFAVILTTKKGKKTFAVAVFNAPFDRRKASHPAFFTTKIESGDMLYFNPNTKRLLVGPYASDAGFALKPSGKTYQAETFND